MNDNIEKLTPIMGQEKAEEILLILEKYDNYILEFKKQINEILLPHGYEVKTGIMFSELTSPGD